MATGYKATSRRLLKNGDADAAIVGPVIEKLAAEHGGVASADVILEEASKKKSPLHRFFEWDDTEAARAYRLAQARELSRSYTVIVTDCEGKSVRARGTIHVSQNGEKGYSPIAHVMESEDLREQAVETARRDLLAWRRKYAIFRAVFGDVFDTIDRIERQHEEHASA